VRVKIILATLYAMAKPRLVIATILAGIALSLALFGIIGNNQVEDMPAGMSGHAT
jgi:hypothetical protein